MCKNKVDRHPIQVAWDGLSAVAECWATALAHAGEVFFLSEYVVFAVDVDVFLKAMKARWQSSKERLAAKCAIPVDGVGEFGVWLGVGGECIVFFENIFVNSGDRDSSNSAGDFVSYGPGLAWPSFGSSLPAMSLVIGVW